jgi:hypothetical protein
MRAARFTQQFSMMRVLTTRWLFSDPYKSSGVTVLTRGVLTGCERVTRMLRYAPIRATSLAIRNVIVRSFGSRM